MKPAAVGLIAEFNPLHNGHLYLLQKVKKQTGLPVIVAMSGNFVQRGQGALINKWLRAETAVRCGADLVLELPTAFALRSADYFAAGGVKTLLATGLVTHLAFGAESPEAFQDSQLPAYLNTPEANARVRELLQQGLTYGAAWQQIAEEWRPGAGAFLTGSNNILGLAYAKELLPAKASVKIVPIKRQGNAYNDLLPTTELPSATALRAMLQEDKRANPLRSFMPLESLEALRAGELCFNNPVPLKTLISYTLANQGSNELYNTSPADSGLCFRVVNNKSKLLQGWDSFMASIISRRYPMPTIRRLMLQLLLQESRSFWLETRDPAYLRVLAFNTPGRRLLKEMKATATLPIITKLGRLQPQLHSDTYNRLLAMDIRATDLYNLLQYHYGAYGEDFTTSPIYVG